MGFYSFSLWFLHIWVSIPWACAQRVNNSFLHAFILTAPSPAADSKRGALYAKTQNNEKRYVVVRGSRKEVSMCLCPSSMAPCDDGVLSHTTWSQGLEIPSAQKLRFLHVPHVLLRRHNNNERFVVSSPGVFKHFASCEHQGHVLCLQCDENVNIYASTCSQVFPPPTRIH